MKAPFAKSHGHLWPYHCEKHNAGHGGACASCLADQEHERDEDYKQGLRDEIEAKDQRIADLMERLEMWGTSAGTGERVLLDESCDGISCRDETIHQQDQRIAELSGERDTWEGVCQKVDKKLQAAKVRIVELESEASDYAAAANEAEERLLELTEALLAYAEDKGAIMAPQIRKMVEQASEDTRKEASSE